MGVKSFVLGFGLGVGSGMALRALAEKDYEPVRDALKRSANLAQQLGDVTLDTVGRLKESVEDITSQLRARPHRETAGSSVGASSSAAKKRTKKTTKSGRKKKTSKARRSEPANQRVLHS